MTVLREIISRELLEETLKVWISAGTGLSLVIQPGDQGEEQREHAIFQYINASNTTHAFTQAEKLSDDSIVQHVVSDTVETYQVAVHHCRDGMQRLERLAAYLEGGVGFHIYDTPNLAFREIRDFGRTSFVEDGVRHWQAIADIDLSFRQRHTFPYNNIETVTFEPCTTLDVEPLTVKRS